MCSGNVTSLRTSLPCSINSVMLTLRFSVRSERCFGCLSSFPFFFLLEGNFTQKLICVLSKHNLTLYSPTSLCATLIFSSSSSKGEHLPGSEDFEMFLHKTLIFYFERILIILHLCEHFTVGLVSSNQQENT